LQHPANIPPPPKPGPQQDPEAEEQCKAEPADSGTNANDWPTSLEELFLFDPNFESCW
jgi:hypothetical protein